MISRAPSPFSTSAPASFAGTPAFRVSSNTCVIWTSSPRGEEAGINYDSAERRQELAASVDGVADHEAIQARLSADQDQGTPPSAAVAKAPARTPKARKTRGSNGQTKLLQKGMSR
jgi:hypothetical protein